MPVRTPSAHLSPGFLYVARPVIALSTLLLPACSSLRTNDARDGVADTRPRVGLHYFLPRGIIHVKGTKENDAYKIEITQSNAPDTSERFFLRQTASLFHDDTSTFKVNEDGLLKESVDSSGDPKVAAIIDKLLETIVNAAKIKTALLNPSAAPGGRVGAAPPAISYRPFTVSFDPFDTAEVSRAERAVHLAGFTMTVTPRPAKPDGESRAQLDRWGTPRSLPSGQPGQSSAGVLYRPPTTVKISFHGDDLTLNYPFTDTKTVTVPDPSRVATYSMKRGVFAKRGQNVVMVAGEPSAVTFSHPSELLALVGLPATITGTVLKEIGPLSNLFYKPAPKSQLPAAAQAAQQAASTPPAPGTPVSDHNPGTTGEGYRTSVPYKESGTGGGGNQGLGESAAGAGTLKLEPSDAPAAKLPQTPGAPPAGAPALIPNH